MYEQSGEYGRNGIELVCEARDNTEVAPSTPQAPEQFGILRFRGANDLTRCSNDLGRDQVVARESTRTHQPTKSTAECQPSDPGRRDRAAGCGKTVGSGCAVKVAPIGAALSPSRTRCRVDFDATHAS